MIELAKKDKKQIDIIFDKINEILNNPNSYNSLPIPLNNWKKVYIDNYFVLIFSVDEILKSVILEDYTTIDIIYEC
jgi:mRNA-degrading endonuclease RelE of RelBE toxin-antitoxin system